MTPFDPAVVQWRAGKVTGDQTLAMAYVDARAVMARLDEAFGAEGWQDSYYIVESLSEYVAARPANGTPLYRWRGGAVQCTITALYPDPNWDAASQQPLRYTTVSRSDVGYPNDSGDPEALKAAYSDAFKRAAVKFGIGRDLYEIEPMWLPYDSNAKRITAFPEYVVGKGWVARGQKKVTTQLATDAMRRKVFAAATAKGKDHPALKVIAQTVVGKDSSKDWTTTDVDKLLGFIGELAAPVVPHG